MKNRLLCLLFALAFVTGPAFALDREVQAELNRQLREAATVDDVDTVRKLLGEGADVNGANEFGKTALMRAVESGASKSAYVLLSKGASVNARTTAGCTALTFAAGSTPPCPGLAPCESFSSTIFTSGSRATAANFSALKLPSSLRQPK